MLFLLKIKIKIIYASCYKSFFDRSGKNYKIGAQAQLKYTEDEVRHTLQNYLHMLICHVVHMFYIYICEACLIKGNKIRSGRSYL